MDILALRKAALEAGFSHYQTMAGAQDIATFNPYGLAPPDLENGRPAGVNWRARFSQYAGELIVVDGTAVIRDLPDGPVLAPFALGAFPLLKGGR